MGVALILLSTTLPADVRASHPVPTPTVVQSNLEIPWDLTFAPDGTMFVTERAGRVRIYASGAPNAELLHTVTVPNVRAEHESGVNGITVDIDFATNRYLYLCAARDIDGPDGPEPWVNEILRYEVSDDHQLLAETVIFTGAKANWQHNGCSLEMDDAGMLWIGIGDAREPALAQDPDSLNGKILRITRDGAVPDDNPMMEGASGVSAVYSMGHRNPQGIAFAPGTGQAYAAEHGPAVDDEINLIQPGANYGWPCVTGFGRPHMNGICDETAELADPAWASGDVTIATSGMTFLEGESWGSWNGSALVAQLKEQDLRSFVLTDGGTTLVQSHLLFDRQFGRLRATIQAPDGSLYLTTSNGSNDRIVRVVPGSVTVDRFAGADRYETAAQISERTFPAGVSVAYVATGLDYPDALAAGAAAASRRAPVLLVRRDSIPRATANELRRLRPDRIVIVGSTAVISQAVENELDTLARFPAGRFGGADRYHTAANLARGTFAPGVPVVYVTTGINFPDALAGVPAAGVQGGPILLVRPTSIPPSTAQALESLDPDRIVVLGSTGVVSSQVEDDLAAFAPTHRHQGPDRYATAVEISKATFHPEGTPTWQVFIATGENFPDGLSGGPAAALMDSPLLLVRGDGLPAIVADELLRLDPDRVTILGGTSVVTEAVQDQIYALLNP